MDSHAVALELGQIAALLELHGESPVATKPFAAAAKRLAAHDAPDIASLIAGGTLASMGRRVAAAIADLAEHGSSTLAEQLREDIPEGLLEMMRVPGLGPATIHRLHAGLGVDTLQELEDAARDGRLAALPGFGARTSARILTGIAALREQGSPVLYPHALAEAHRLLAHIRANPDVERAEITGAIRRRAETLCAIDIVAGCRAFPARVAASFTRGPGVRDVIGGGGRSLTIRYADGFRLNLHCVTMADFPVALWRTTGSDAHVTAVRAHAALHGMAIAGDTVRDSDGRSLALVDEIAFYRAVGLDWVAPELREGRGEVGRAAVHGLPDLIRVADLRGVLHCHSGYSDGETTIASLAAAAQERGWSYLGVSDHSQSAFYAGGLDRDGILRQHDEIDAINGSGRVGFRVLKGIEADILPCGRVDYDEATLDRFDYVIASVHSRMGMNERQMTDRVLKALDDPHVTIVGHPTGRLLLTREPFAIDIDALLAKAGETGVAIELNADPHRLDLDWRFLQAAKRHGVQVEIGPDAHSVAGLDNVELGVGIARKGWLEARDVLNTRSADDVIAFARARRPGAMAAAVDAGTVRSSEGAGAA
jgi:DNA polymerase (family 10)